MNTNLVVTPGKNPEIDGRGQGLGAKHAEWGGKLIVNVNVMTQHYKSPASKNQLNTNRSVIRC